MTGKFASDEQRKQTKSGLLTEVATSEVGISGYRDGATAPHLT